MWRLALIGILIGAVLAPSAATAADPARARKHSGVIVALAPEGAAVTIEEMGVWTGPATKPRKRPFPLRAATKIEFAFRSAEAVNGGWPGGFRISPLRAVDLRRGDFATVTVERRGGRRMVSDVVVVRPQAGE